jgi:hypothetical protein
MTQQFTVRIEGAQGHAALHRQVLASLPEHFRIVTQGNADASLWSGDDPPPGDPRVSVLADLAVPKRLTPGPLVIPAARFAPRLAADAGFARVRGNTFRLINAVATFTPSNNEPELRAYLDALAAIRLLTGARPRIASLDKTRHGFAVTLTLEGKSSVVTLAAVRQTSAAADTLTLDAISDTLRLHARLDAGAMARPGCIELSDAGGSSHAPSVHQNDHRLTWLAAHAVLSGSDPRLASNHSQRREDFEAWQQATSPG